MRPIASRWEIFILLAVTAAALASTDGIASPIASAIVLGFVLFCPGMVVVRWLKLNDLLAEIVIAIGLSLAMCTITGAAMIYLGRWNPHGGVAFLLIFTIVGTVFPLRVRERRVFLESSGQDAPASRAGD